MDKIENETLLIRLYKFEYDEFGYSSSDTEPFEDATRNGQLILLKWLYEHVDLGEEKEDCI